MVMSSFSAYPNDMLCAMCLPKQATIPLVTITKKSRVLLWSSFAPNFQFTHLHTSFSQLGDRRSSASHSSRVLDGVADVADAFRMTPRSSRYTWSIGCSQVLGRPSWMLDKRKVSYQRGWVSTRVFATDSSLHKKKYIRWKVHIKWCEHLLDVVGSPGLIHVLCPRTWVSND